MSTTHENVGGVVLNNVTHARLENCIITYKNTGLEIDNSDGITVVNCTMDNNADGMTIEWSNHTSITNCYFTNTTTGSGFYQDNSHWTLISNSYFIRNGDYGLECYWSDFFTFTGNEATGNDYAGLLVENSHYGEYQYNTLFENYEEGVIFYNSHNVTFIENTIYNNDRYGLSLVGPQDGYFAHNVIHNNTLEGINYDTGENSILKGNTVYDNGWTNFGLGGTACGILVEDVENCTLFENHVYNNSQHGIYLDTSPHSSIDSNTVYGNYGVEGECGIYIYYSDSSIITGNIVYNNTENGIYLDLSKDCNVTYNVVFENTESGFRLEDCNRTLIYCNDFGWNQLNAYSTGGSTDINYWDSGVVGNWWSDYGGSGPYNISGSTGEQDMYPSNSLVLGTAADVQYEFGSTGNTLFLAAQALNPDYYEVTVDTASVGTFTWNGKNIYVNIDDLEVGEYIISVDAHHISGHYLTQSAIVTVLDTTAPEWVVTPSDQSIGVGQAFSYEVSATDLSEIGEWFVNDTVHFNIVDGLITNNTVLEAGAYGLNITVVDIYGNAKSVLITIRVGVAVIPTPPVIVLIMGGIAIAAVGVVLVIFMKKRG